MYASRRSVPPAPAGARYAHSLCGVVLGRRSDTDGPEPLASLAAVASVTSVTVVLSEVRVMGKKKSTAGSSGDVSSGGVRLSGGEYQRHSVEEQSVPLVNALPDAHQAPAASSRAAPLRRRAPCAGDRSGLLACSPARRKAERSLKPAPAERAPARRAARAPARRPQRPLLGLVLAAAAAITNAAVRARLPRAALGLARGRRRLLLLL